MQSPLLSLLTVVSFISLTIAEIQTASPAIAQSAAEEQPVSPEVAPVEIPSESTEEASYQVGDTVEVFWGESWWAARVVRTEGNQYCITYIGYSSSSDECVGGDRIRAVTDPEKAALPAENNRSVSQRISIESFTVTGRLDSNSLVLDDDGTYYNMHLFEGISGQSIVIEMSSNELDTYLILQTPDSQWIAQNDNGDGTNSRIVITLPTTGTYAILANAYVQGERSGSYTLSLREALTNELNLVEGNHLLNQVIPIESFTTTGQLDSNSLVLDDDGTYYNMHPFEGILGQSIVISMSSDELDTYLILQAPNGGWIAQNDDSDGNNSRIAITLPTTGTYTILANAYAREQSGSYTLSLQEASPNDLSLAAVERFLNQGFRQFNIGRFQVAMQLFQQALSLHRQANNRLGEADSLVAMGRVATATGSYQQALELYQQALNIQQNVNVREAFPQESLANESTTLNNIGVIYHILGQYEQALNIYQEDLALQREIGDHLNEATILNNIGTVYVNLGQYQQALTFYQEALTIHSRVGGRLGECSTLTNIGRVYTNLRQYQQALEQYQQALVIARDIRNRVSEGVILSRIGDLHFKQENYAPALEYYQRSLSIVQEVGDRANEGHILNSIGNLLAAQNQPELAITFLKQSVNVRESIRDDIRGLPVELQQSYTDTVADDYRGLADLLLQRNRILEAQRVLDLLRVQELDDYLRGVRSTDQTETSIDLRHPEQEISNRVIAVGYELAQLRDIPPDQLTDAQIQRLSELDATQRELAADFQGFLNSPEIQALVAQLDANLQEQDVLTRAEEFINLQQNLRAIDQNAVLIYPLILEGRLELVLITPFSEPARYPVSVSSAELNTAIVEFRQALRDPQSNPRLIAQQLYTWLIAPMANDLEAIGAETILYAPDGALRYVPLAALYDGRQWLVERYRINHITAASLQNWTLRPDGDPRILAAAFSEGNYDFQVGQRSFSFAGLPFAEVEVENLAAAFPGTTELMNDRFSRSLVEPLMDSHSIVHLATHAAFVPGSPADSFILFGNGDRLSLQEIRETWQGRFNRVNLIVLSACETGVGDVLGNGEEILGFGYLMQEAGAEAAIASLWQVSDGGTQVLMDAFYAALNNGYSKAEALQRAQQALITSDQSILQGERSIRVEITDARTEQPLSQSSDLAHPYYWAPFILIGNGL